jgi:hypothetical protein
MEGNLELLIDKTSSIYLYVKLKALEKTEGAIENAQSRDC